jgi:PAS domain S-box-containing protein
MESALRASDHRYRELVEGSIQGLVVIADNKLVFANQAIADILGYDGPDDLLGVESVGTLIHSDDRERLRTRRDVQLQGEQIDKVAELRAIRRDGSTVWLESSPSTVEWGGEPATQTVIVDITERRNAEQALQNLNQELEQRVDDRTRELAEKSNLLEAT